MRSKRTVVEAFKNTAGSDNLLSRSEFLGALDTIGSPGGDGDEVRLSTSIPVALRPRLFDACLRFPASGAAHGLTAGELAGVLGVPSGPHARFSSAPSSSAFAHKEVSRVSQPPLVSPPAPASASEEVIPGQFRFMVDLLGQGERMPASVRLVLLFFLHDADGSGGLDEAEHEALWGHLFDSLVSVRRGSGSIAEEGLGSPPGQGKGDGATAERGRSTWMALRPVVHEAVFTAAAEPGAPGGHARRAGVVSLADVISVWNVVVRAACIGVALGVQMGVLDGATSDRIGGAGRGPAGSVFDAARPEQLRFTGSEYDHLRQAFADATGARSGAAGRYGDALAIDAEGFNALFAPLLSSPALRLALFRYIDADGSGEVSFAELVVALDALVNGTPDERVRVHFRLYDADASGELDTAEVGIMIKDAMLQDPRLAPDAATGAPPPGHGHHEGLTDAAIRTLVVLADGDRSGTLSQDEVVQRASAFIDASSAAVKLLPAGTIFPEVRHPMHASPWMGVILGTLAMLPAMAFNLFYDGPFAYGPLLRDKFGWSIADLGLLATLYQAMAVPGNLLVGSLVDRFGPGWPGVSTSACVLVAMVLQSVALSGSGSYVLVVVSRCLMGLAEGGIAVASVLTVEFFAPNVLTTVGAVRVNTQMGATSLSRLVLSQMSLDTYGVVMAIMAASVLAGCFAVVLVGPRFGFPVTTSPSARSTNVGRPLHTTLAQLAGMAPGVPKIRRSAVRRMPLMFWMNVVHVSALYITMMALLAYGPFWFTSAGDARSEANLKANIGNFIVLATTVPIGAAANYFGYRAHVLTAGFAPTVAAGLLAIFFGFDFSTWAYVAIYSAGWGAISALSFGLIPFYLRDKGLHGTAYGLILSLSSVASGAALFAIAALAPTNDQPGDDSFFIGANVVLACVAGSTIPAGVAMIILDRYTKYLSTGARGNKKDEGTSDTRRLVLAF